MGGGRILHPAATTLLRWCYTNVAKIASPLERNCGAQFGPAFFFGDTVMGTSVHVAEGRSLPPERPERGRLGGWLGAPLYVIK